MGEDFKDPRAEYVAAISAPLICGMVAAWFAGMLSGVPADNLTQFLCAVASATCVVIAGRSAWKIASENTMLYWTLKQMQDREDAGHADAD